MIVSDLEYLRYLPFLSNAGQIVKDLNITIEKIENTNIFNSILQEIYKEVSTLITNDIKTYPLETPTYEVSKFYLSVLLLKGIDNIAITRIWVKHFKKKIYSNIQTLLMECKTEQARIKTILDIFELLELNQYFILRRITIDGNVAFGLHMMKYLDIEDSLFDEVTTVHNGYVIIPCQETEFIIKLVQDFAVQKFYKLYEKADLDISITRKIKFTTDKIKEDVINSQKVSVNVKKHWIKKELLYEQERVKDVEHANRIVKQLDDLSKENLVDYVEGMEIKAFPPCVNVILHKLIIKKKKLSHNENILLCTYLGKKHFDIEQVKKIFSKAVNYDPSVTGYQVTFLYKKKMMCGNCVNLQTEGICKKELDKTNQCGRIKNPLSFR